MSAEDRLALAKEFLPPEKTPCPSCGKDALFGWHCPDCLKKQMDSMTPEDWHNAFSQIARNVNPTPPGPTGEREKP